jgi:hypothetical protein
MQWWTDFLEWLGSDEGWRIVSGAVIPFLAIVIGALVAAVVARGALKRLVGQRDRETRAGAVAALISAGQNAARWQSQTPQARERAEQLAAEADIAVRLLPIQGTELAADWAVHELAAMRTNSVSFSFQADQSLEDYRERLVTWLHHPGRAKKLFGADLDRWRYEERADPVVIEQQRWAEEQFTAATSTPLEHAPERPLPTTPIASAPSSLRADGPTEPDPAR